MDRTGPCPGLALRRLEQAQRKWRTLIFATTREIQRRSAGYRAAAAGDLPAIRLGRRLYVPTARLCALIGLPLEAAG